MVRESSTSRFNCDRHAISLPMHETRISLQFTPAAACATPTTTCKAVEHIVHINKLDNDVLPPSPFFSRLRDAS